jgi:hypothetical protein
MISNDLRFIIVALVVGLLSGCLGLGIVTTALALVDWIKGRSA